MRTNIQLATTLNNDYPNRNGVWADKLSKGDVIYADNELVVYLSHRVVQTPSGIGSRTMLITYYKVITINGEAEVNDIASFIRSPIRTVSE
jgi:hypothetical protein|tara:strand:+ start:261 stop:533 length:273 start_codon:yes stop_codon:yes gene_type:complete